MRTRSFDKAGNASPILERVIRVDKSNPSNAMRSFPRSGNEQGWFRRHAVDSVAAHDGRDGSGADSATFKIDSDGPASYLAPFNVGDGIHQVEVQARDFAGRKGTVDKHTQRIDTMAPLGGPVGATPLLTIPLLGLPSPVPLRFTASDALTPRVKVTVYVYNSLLGLVRRLPVNGPHPFGYRDNGTGAANWDGRDSSNRGVLPGLYHYRVHIIDQAGNTVLSDESPPFLVILGVLPL